MPENVVFEYLLYLILYNKFLKVGYKSNSNSNSNSNCNCMNEYVCNSKRTSKGQVIRLVKVVLCKRIGNISIRGSIPLLLNIL